jgi:hypothetical protein
MKKGIPSETLSVSRFSDFAPSALLSSFQRLSVSVFRHFLRSGLAHPAESGANCTIAIRRCSQTSRIAGILGPLIAMQWCKNDVQIAIAEHFGR